MKLKLLLIFFPFTFFGCKSKVAPARKSYSEIATITNKIENALLDRELKERSNVSTLARDYNKELPKIEAKAAELKSLFKTDQGIPSSYQRAFIDSFANSLKYVSKGDSLALDLLKEANITSEQDVDQLVLYMKRAYLNNVSFGERYHFNVLSTSFAMDNYDIKKGDEVTLTFNITAANTNVPAEWFILKDGSKPLVKENISDTLYPDEMGNVKFKRKAVKTGENWIDFATKVQSTQGEVTLYRTANFNVR